MAASDNNLPFQNNYYSRISLNISFLLYPILLFIFACVFYSIVCVLIFSQLIMSFILWPSEIHTWEHAAIATSYKNKNLCSSTKKQCKIETFIAYWLDLVGPSWPSWVAPTGSRWFWVVLTGFGLIHGLVISRWAAFWAALWLEMTPPEALLSLSKADQHFLYQLYKISFTSCTYKVYFSFRFLNIWNRKSKIKFYAGSTNHGAIRWFSPEWRWGHGNVNLFVISRIKCLRKMHFLLKCF